MASDSDDLPILKGILRGDCTYTRYETVRFGRVPKREKAKILAAMQKSSNARTQEQALTAELDDELKLMSTVIHAHMETCEFTSDKVNPMIAKNRERPNYATCASSLMVCPLNPTAHPVSGHNNEVIQDFSARFSPAIKGVVEFAKRIPGFSILAQDDQVTLLKAAVFEVLLVRLACMFDSQTNSMMCLNGQQIRRESVQNSCNARFLLDSMFDFSERMNRLGLTDPEIGLFCSVVVITPDRPGLRNVELIERMQNKLKHCLHSRLVQCHPQDSLLFDELLKKIPDLRTLNTLHSEKLLAYKMTEQQQQQQRMAAGQQQLPLPPMWENTPWRHVVKEELNLYEDSAKSPVSVSSSGSEGSVCNGEVAKLTELAGQFRMCPRSMEVLSPKRRRDDSDGDETSSLDSPKCRKLDSPTDSGIDSGSDKQNLSPMTSECSSPRSSNDEKSVETFEDMPVLKRALQAPPLKDMNSLIDAAYRPHKKFRALRKETPEPEAPPAVPSQHQSGASLIASHVYNGTYKSVLSAALMAPVLGCPRSLSTTHSMLTKSLMECPKMTDEERKRTDILQTMIMKAEPSDRDYYSSSHTTIMKAEPSDYNPQPQQPVVSQLQQQLQRPPAPVWPALPASPNQQPQIRRSPAPTAWPALSQSPEQKRSPAPVWPAVSPSPPQQRRSPAPSATWPAPTQQEQSYVQIKVHENLPLNLSKKTPPPPMHISQEA